MRRTKLLVLGVVVAGGLIAGCGDSDPAPGKGPAAPPGGKDGGRSQGGRGTDGKGGGEQGRGAQSRGGR